MEFEEFVSAYGSEWSEEEVLQAELLWYSDFLDSYDTRGAYQEFKAYAASKAPETQSIYRAAKTLMTARHTVEMAKARMEGRVYG